MILAGSGMQFVEVLGAEVSNVMSSAARLFPTPTR